MHHKFLINSIKPQIFSNEHKMKNLIVPHDDKLNF